MADGGCYEGMFVRGEIEGHGYRLFGLSGASYSGQFQAGEMHGQGVYRKHGTSEQYEGSWVHGKREGQSAPVIIGCTCTSVHVHLLCGWTNAC